MLILRAWAAPGEAGLRRREHINLGWLRVLGLSRSRQDAITVGEFTISRLKDYRQSYIEVLNLKHAMRDEILQTWLPGIGLPIEHVKKCRRCSPIFQTCARL